MVNEDKLTEILKLIKQGTTREPSANSFGLTQKEYFEYISALKDKNLIAGAYATKIREHKYSVRICDAVLTKKGIEFIKVDLEKISG